MANNQLFARFGTDADNKLSKVSTIAFRNGAASRKAMATNNGQAHTAKTRILIADDHPLFRHGFMDFISSQADMTVCGEADSIPNAQSKLAECTPDLIVLGLCLGTGDTLDFIKALRAQKPKLPILVFSQYEEGLFAERALRAGAKGYLMKKTGKEELLAAIRDILSGQVYVSRALAMRAFQKSLETQPQHALGRPTRVENLSDREMHVFQLIGSGLGTRKIADALNLSVKTIETYRENIKGKLGLRNGAELTERATTWVMENLLPQQTNAISVVKKKKVVAFRAA